MCLFEVYRSAYHVPELAHYVPCCTLCANVRVWGVVWWASLWRFCAGAVFVAFDLCALGLTIVRVAYNVARWCLWSTLEV